MKTKKLSVIIQARLNSTRLPKKIMLPVSEVNHLTLLEYMFNRLENVLDFPIIFCIPDTNANDELAEFLSKKKIKFFRGNESDVLSRYLQCAKQFRVKNIIRLTSDCPLVDPYLIIQMAKIFFDKSLEYLSNTCPPELSTFPDGSDIEIFTFDALEKADSKVKSTKYREHVTFQFWDGCHQFKQEVFEQKKPFAHLRYTIDHYEDYIVFKKIYENLLSKSEHFCGYKEIQNFLEINKGIQKLNSSFRPGDNW